MAAVIGLNGQVETFASLNSPSSDDDHPHDVLLHVNKVARSTDTCYVAKTCPLTDKTGKLMADVTADPGYVIKAAATGNGTKVFVNVCSRESVDKPSSAKQIARGGRFGLSWTIPHTVTEQLIDGSRYQTCRVFDFQVHPDTCRMAETNKHFKNMLNELAVGAVAGEFNVSLNVRKLHFPKIKYKTLQVHSQKKAVPVPPGSSETIAEVSDKKTILNACKQQTIEISADGRTSEVLPWKKTTVHADADIDANNNRFTAPTYTVTFSPDRQVPVVNSVTYSQLLLVDIELPCVDSALSIDLYVFEKSLSLVSTGPVQYKLEIDLPCVVDENCSFARFTKSRKVLHVMMPVLTSSSACTSSAESSSVIASDSGEPLVSESVVNTDSVSAFSVLPSEAAGGQKDLSAVDESVNYSTNVDGRMPQFSHSQDLETVKLGADSWDDDSCKRECEDDDDKLVSDVELLRKSTEDISSEIVVVHAKGVPKLHGILKQRTVSESSDVSGCDYQASTTTTGSEGDDNECSPERSSAPALSDGRRILKKSVSFNDHVDHTLFQANQSVSSMHAALKNRRRRARKRDQKQDQRQRRRRRRSSGSFSLEESGDEQTTHLHDAEKDGGNSCTSTQSNADASDCCSSFVNVTSAKGDNSCCGSISDGRETADEQFQHALGHEFSEDEKLVQSESQNNKVEAGNENCDYPDAFRTKHDNDYGSNMKNGDQNIISVCDGMPSVHMLGSDETCESEKLSIANVLHAGHVSLAELALSCSHEADIIRLKSSHSNNSSASCPMEKTAVLTVRRELDLDVD